jgi:hypothetical protein
VVMIPDRSVVLCNVEQLKLNEHAYVCVCVHVTTLRGSASWIWNLERENVEKRPRARN